MLNCSYSQILAIASAQLDETNLSCKMQEHIKQQCNVVQHGQQPRVRLYVKHYTMT